MTVIIFWAIMAYGMSTILVYGSIFDKGRAFIKRNSKFFGELIGCMLCTSTWVGFFFSICFGGLTNKVLEMHWLPTIFFDGMFTAGAVWAINGIIEFFEENRIK
jgi:hypothetical protein